MTKKFTKEDVVKLWNETRLSTQQISEKVYGQFSRASVCGIVHRARKAGLITRIVSRSPVARQPKRSRRGKSNPHAEALAKARAIERQAPEYFRTMGEAVLALRPGQCRWPTDNDEAFSFCQHDAKVGCYCDYHADLSSGRTNPEE